MSPKSRSTAPTRARFTLKDLVLLVVLAVVFGFIYWALVQAWTALSILMGPAGDLAQHFLSGSWLLVAPIAIAILRRPLAGILAEVLASVIEVVFLGSAVGPILFIAAALQGAGSEIPFAVTRYRSYGWATYALSGLMGSGLV
ncbi:MAG TPA: ECF transporter S component, partial [Glaciihabitans sp.]|nr:ECF transporter S component [Glaciihabitans sp.]